MRVLIVDHDEVLLEIARQYLSVRGHEVNIATNGLETVASLRRNVPDVLVLDQDLLWGGCDGVLALMQESSDWSEIPLILTSADAMPEDCSSVGSLPVIARLQKPYLLKQLVVHVHACNVKEPSGSLSAVVQGRRP